MCLRVCVCACIYREYRKAAESTHAAARLGECWMILTQSQEDAGIFLPIHHK